MTKRQWREVAADTALVHFTLSLVWALLGCGAAVIMERPTFPVWALGLGRVRARDPPASAWSLRVVGFDQACLCAGSYHQSMLVWFHGQKAHDSACGSSRALGEAHHERWSCRALRA